MYRALVIGCGRIGSLFDEGATGVPRSHAGAYRRHPRVKLAALCDVNRQRVQDAARYWDVEHAFDNPLVALDRVRPEIVSICTPDDDHSRTLELVFDSPGVRAVLAEKPLAKTAAEAQRLAALAARRGIALLVNYSRRYSFAWQSAQRDIHAGCIGRIQSVAGYYSNGVMHNGTHWFDLARWFAGECRVVRAGIAEREYPGDPTLDVVIAFDSGARGHLMGVRQEYFAFFEFDIVGESGRLRVSTGPMFEWSVVRDNHLYKGFRHAQVSRVDKPDAESPLLMAVENMLACLENGAAPLCGAEDAVAAMRLAEQALAEAAAV